MPRKEQQLNDEMDAYLRDSVAIEPLALNEEFIRLPADLARWNHLYAKALRAHLTAKLVKDQTLARLRMEVRERLASTEVDKEGKPKGKPTVGDIDAALELEEDVQTVRLTEIETEVEKVRLHGVLDAVRTKRDMLIQMGAHVRAEMQGDPQLRSLSRDSRT